MISLTSPKNHSSSLRLPSAVQFLATTWWLPIILAALTVSLLAGSRATAAGPLRLISRKSTVWRAWDRLGHEPVEGQAWRSRNFDDSHWREARGMMGYGDEDIDTRLSYGNDPQRKPIAALFRSRFRYNRASQPGACVGGRLCCDDGAVVWVNGHETFRHNMPTGEIEASTLAVQPVGPDASSERKWYPFLISADHLRSGENVIAVSVHQAKCTSSDLAMSCEVFELTDAAEVAAFRQAIQQRRRGAGQRQDIKVQIGPVARLKFSRD